MELQGSLRNNLTNAIQSARRLRGYPVHQDTLGHWDEILKHARCELAEDSPEAIQTLIVELEDELVSRKA